MSKQTSSSYPHLFEPIKVGHLQLPNRLIMGSMHTNLESKEGGIETIAEFYAARAKKEVGLIITGGWSPNQEGNLGFHAATMMNEEDANKHQIIAQRVHEEGGRIILQLLHSGRYGLHQNNVAPSAIRAPINPFIPKELSPEEILQTISDFANAAHYAKMAGYDGVEIMGSEGYLLTQFLCERTNQRQDEWGGSFENRMRFPIGIIRSVREKVGNDFVISYRISALDLVEGGLVADEIVELSQEIEKAGADLITTGIGWHEARIPTISQAVPMRGFAWVAKRLKDELQIPIAATNKIHTPEDAEHILQEKVADMVALARPLLADESFAQKARLGMRDQINLCISCNQACLDHYFEDRGVSCLVNPRAGREQTITFDKTSQPKKVVVVGAGPAGLSCADAAAERGHHVVLFEQQNALGGQFLLAKRIPGKNIFADTIHFYLNQIQDKKVDIRLGVSATKENIEQENPDEVVIASGIVPRVPAIEGIDHPKVTFYPDILENRSGKFSTEQLAGKKVVIIGGGGIAFDVALFLLEQGSASLTDSQAFNERWGIDRNIEHPGGIIKDRKVHQAPFALTMLKRSKGAFGKKLGRTTGWVHRLVLKEQGVNFISEVQYKKIDDQGLHLEVEGSDRLLEVDHILICAGQEPNQSLKQQLKSLEEKTHWIGGSRLADKLDAKRAFEEGVLLAHQF